MSLQLFPVVWVPPRSLGVICYDRWVLSEGQQNLLQGLVSHELTAYFPDFDLFLTQWTGHIIHHYGHIPDKFESHNSQKLSFTNIQGVFSNLVEWESFLPWIKFSWHSCPVWDKLGKLNWLWQFLCEGLVLQFMWRKGFLSHGTWVLIYVFDLQSVSYFFFLYQSPSSLFKVFNLFHLTSIRFSQSNFLLMCLFLDLLLSILGLANLFWLNW